MAKPTWQKDFDKLLKDCGVFKEDDGYCNDSEGLIDRTVEVGRLQAFITNEIEKAQQEAREEFVERLRKESSYSPSPGITATFGVTSEVINKVLAKYRKEEK